MFQQKDISMRTANVQNSNNGVKHHQQIINNSAINQTTTANNTNNSKSHHQSKSSSFIKFLNPFSSSKSKSQTLSDSKNSDSDQKTNSVKALKQFWNDQIKTAKSSENLSQKSATIKYFSQSNDSLNDCRRTEKSLTLDSSLRYPLDDFNKFKDANFVRTKKSKLFSGYSECNHQLDSVEVRKYSRTESSNLNDSHFPQVSATGGKIHWAKRDDIFTPKVKSPTENTNKNSDTIMSVKTNKTNGSAAAASSSSTTKNYNGKTFESKTLENVVNKSSRTSRSTRSDSMTSSIASSIGSTNSSNTNSASRKISFKTNPSTTSSYMNKKLAANNSSNSNKVAQIAQRFNQMIQQDATILEEVKKRGGVVVHRSGGRVFKIKEEKATAAAGASATSSSISDKGNGSLTKKSINNNSVDDTSAAISDDAISLPSMGKNSTRKKSSLRKRPSIRIMVESPRKDGNGNVLSKRQLYEANVVNKETIVIKPKVPDKSERVLAKTKELKNKKILNEIMKTEVTKAVKTNEATTNASNNELNNNSNTDLNSNINSSYNKKEEDQLPKIDETIEPIKDATASKNNFRKIYDKLTFRSTFLYGKKAHNKQEMTSTCLVQKEIIVTETNVSEDETELATESNKPYNDDQTSAVASEIDDDFELKPIDLNLNVYFNNENLSNNIIVDKNIISQGPQIVDSQINDVTTESINANIKPENQQQNIEMKPNSSFLFRTQPSTKADTACDTFIRSMLNENSSPNDVDNIEANLPSKTNLSASTGSIECNVDDSLSVKVEIQEENDYEIISREDSNDNDIDILAKVQKRNFECDDIDDKSNNSNAKTGLKNETERIVEIEIEKEEEEEEEQVENIYQSLCEVKGSINNVDTMSVKSYESFENYDEIKQNILDNKINLSDILKCEDDYIFPEAISEIPPELPAPRQKHSIPKISSPILTSTTSNLVQANLSVPKLCNINYELQKSNSCNSTTYERIKYDQLPKHSKQQQQHSYQPLPPRNNTNSNTNINKNIQHSTENIYDTIKNGDTRSISTDYEKIPELDNNFNNDKNIRRKDALQKQQEDCESFDMSDDADNPYKNSKNDTMSIISNCYESISLKQSYSTINQILRHAISTTTLSSEHRINSIYGIGQSLTPPSDRSGGSDNSEEWIDVETEDEAETNDRFIV